MDFFSLFQISSPDFLSTFGLMMTGFGLVLNAIEKRASNSLEITKQHRELWIWIRSQPDLSRIFDTQADTQARKITDEERWAVGYVILHFAAVYRNARTGMHKLPEKTGLDIRGFFSRPVPYAVWNSIKQYHDQDFIRFVERELRHPVDNESI